MRHLFLLVLLAACAPASSPPPPIAPVTERAVLQGPETTPPVGVLVMAHGGTPEWNASVRAAVEPLSEALPTAIAFGMADPLTLEAGMAALEEAGVERVAVVRMFLSGESFLEQTEYFLGLSDVRPHRFLLMGEARRLGPAPSPVAHQSEIATHDDGIMRSREAAEIIASRTLDLAQRPAGESVLLIAHGMGDDRANDRVLQAMELAASLIGTHGFANVRAETLREDWPEKRAGAEAQIRRFVAAEAAKERRVIVVPYRLAGFGPYADVLEGLNYTPAQGLSPHPRLSDWLKRTASDVICAQGWTNTIGSCATAEQSATPPSPTGDI